MHDAPDRSTLNDTAAMDLYALPPGDFTAARDAAVKQARTAGDKVLVASLSALRRPTASAHAVNALVRAHEGMIDELLDLGGRIAQAQVDGSAAALRELGERRHRLVQAATDRAAQVVGALGAAARAEVAATLEAALADPASGEAVRSGRLVRALSYAGFGGVDLAGAVAPAPADTNRAAAPARSQPKHDRGAGSSAAAAAPGQPERDRWAEASVAAQTAAGAVDDAVREAEQAEQRRARAERQAAQSDERVEAAEQARAEAGRERDAAQVVMRHAQRDLERLHAAIAAAQHTAERARAVLARLAAPS